MMPELPGFVEPLPPSDEVQMQATCPVCGQRFFARGRREGTYLNSAVDDLVNHVIRAHKSQLIVRDAANTSINPMVQIKCLREQCPMFLAQRFSVDPRAMTYDRLGVDQELLRHMVMKALQHYDQEHGPIFVTAWDITSNV